MRVSVGQLSMIAMMACQPMGQSPSTQPAQQQQPQDPSYVSSGPPGGAYEADSRQTEWQQQSPPQAPGPQANQTDWQKQPGQGEMQAPVERKAPAPPSGDSQRLVDVHNSYRSQHCAGPLAWSPKLAQVAQQWANSLRDQGCMFGHSNGAYGENLAAGTIGVMTPDEVVRMWYDEIKEYRFPDGGFSMKTGHFTQVVWRGTKQVGCGHVQCKGMDIWVCEYDPPGNVEGEYRDNVKPRGCK